MTTLASDNFNRANNADLGSAWDVVIGQSAFQILGNRAVLTVTGGSDAMESYNAVTFPANQWAQVTLGVWQGALSAGGGVLLRTSATAKTFYGINAERNGAQTIRIFKAVDEAFTDLATENATTWAVGDVLRAEIIGTRIEVFRNGSSRLSVIDAEINAGRTGMSIFSYETVNLDSVELDDWSAGDFLSPLPFSYAAFPKPKLRR